LVIFIFGKVPITFDILVCSLKMEATFFFEIPTDYTALYLRR
jgi:hypothetical protein